MHSITQTELLQQFSSPLDSFLFRYALESHWQHNILQSSKCLNQIETLENNGGKPKTDWLAPIIADAEAGFGGALNAFEITRAYIEAGVAGVRFEDQLASEKKCGHMGGKVLIPV